MGPDLLKPPDVIAQVAAVAPEDIEGAWHSTPTSSAGGRPKQKRLHNGSHILGQADKYSWSKTFFVLLVSCPGSPLKLRVKDRSLDKADSAQKFQIDPRFSTCLESFQFSSPMKGLLFHTALVTS